MSNKWQIVVLGLIIAQGASLSAMENKSTNSPRNVLACSTEVRKEAAAVEALKRSLERKNSEDLSNEAKRALNCTGWHSGCWGRCEEEYPTQLKHNAMRDIYPYFPHGR